MSKFKVGDRFRDPEDGDIVEITGVDVDGSYDVKWREDTSIVAFQSELESYEPLPPEEKAVAEGTTVSGWNLSRAGEMPNKKYTAQYGDDKGAFQRWDAEWKEHMRRMYESIYQPIEAPVSKIEYLPECRHLPIRGRECLTCRNKRILAARK